MNSLNLCRRSLRFPDELQAPTSRSTTVEDVSYHLTGGSTLLPSARSRRTQTTRLIYNEEAAEMQRPRLIYDSIRCS